MDEGVRVVAQTWTEDGVWHARVRIAGSPDPQGWARDLIAGELRRRGDDRPPRIRRVSTRAGFVTFAHASAATPCLVCGQDAGGSALAVSVNRGWRDVSPHQRAEVFEPTGEVFCRRCGDGRSTVVTDGELVGLRNARQIHKLAAALAASVRRAREAADADREGRS